MSAQIVAPAEENTDSAASGLPIGSIRSSAEELSSEFRGEAVALLSVMFDAVRALNPTDTELCTLLSELKWLFILSD